MLSENLPQEIIAQVLSVPIAECDIHDQVIWGQTSSGIFSVKSAYNVLCDEQGFQKYVWMKIWSIPILPKD